MARITLIWICVCVCVYMYVFGVTLIRLIGSRYAYAVCVWVCAETRGAHVLNPNSWWCFIRSPFGCRE